MKILNKLGKIQKRILKILMWFAISILSLIIILFIWLALFFPSEFVKGLIEEQGTKQLGRVIKIESLSVSLFSGIKIKNFSIFDVKTQNQAIALKGGAVFIKAGEIDLSYKLLPILWKKLEIKNAVIRQPQINVVKFQGGSFNFSDIINRLTAPPAPGEKIGRDPERTSHILKKIFTAIFKKQNTQFPILAAVAQPQTTNPKTEESSPMEFDVKRVGIENALLTYTDYSIPGVPARFTVDRLNFIVSDIDSKNPKKPAKLLISFQISAQRVEGQKLAPKLFNLYTEINGDLYLFNKDGKMLNTPAIYLRIDFKDGLLSGSQFQKIINQVLEDLKKKFFTEFAKQILNITGNFDKILKEKTQEFIKKYSGKIDELTKKLLGSRDTTTGEAGKEKTGLQSDYKKKANDTIAKIDNTIKGFTDTANKLLSAYRLINRGKADELQKKVNEYSQQLQNQSNKAKERINGGSGQMGGEFDGIIGKIKKYYDDAIKNIEKTFNSVIEKYIKNIQTAVHNRLKNYVKKIEDFKLNLPFLEKELTFDYGNLLLSYVNGVATVQRLYIGSPKFKIRAEKIVYNTNNDAVDATTGIDIDKKYNKNIFTNFFADEGQDLQMQIKVTRTLSNPDVSLIGIDLNDRFKQFAIKYGKQLAMNIFGKDLPIDKLFGSGTGAGGATDYKSQMKNVANKYLQKLVGEQTSIDGEKNKYLAEIQKAVKGSGGTAPTQRVRNIFRR